MDVPFAAEQKYQTSTADVIIVNEKNEVLLAQRNVEPYKNFWILPGGRIKQEQPHEAAVRKVYEEISVIVKLDYLYGTYSSLGKRSRGARVTVVYVGHIVEGFIQKTIKISDVMWCTQNDLPKDIGFHHRRILEDYFTNSQRQPLN